MTATHFDWSSLISKMTDENFGISPDVTFQIEENGQLHEVKAHKMLLGMVSPTFKTMFYATNAGDKSAKVIKIEKTTAPAFQIMMDAIYNVKSIEDSLKGKSVHEIFDVMIVVERYHIVELIEAAKELLAKYPIADDTVLEVAGDAMEYTNMFETEAQQLLLNCAKFLKSKLKDLNAVTRYAAEIEDRKEVFASLLVKMNDMAPTECPNCNKETCKDGEEVRDDEFREGLVVTNNVNSDYWEDDHFQGDSGKNYCYAEDWGTGRVTKVAADTVTVVSIKPGVTDHSYNSYQFRGDDYPKKYFEPNFRFSCN